MTEFSLRCPHCQGYIEIQTRALPRKPPSASELKWPYNMPLYEFLASLPRCKIQRRVQHVIGYRVEQFRTVGELWIGFASMLREPNYGKVAHRWLWQQLTDVPYSERPRS
jgi:hypothetical protein